MAIVRLMRSYREDKHHGWKQTQAAYNYHTAQWPTSNVLHGKITSPAQQQEYDIGCDIGPS